MISSTTFERVVIAGQKALIQRYHHLYPNCKPIGQVTVRVVAPPKNGSITTGVGKSFPGFAANRVRAKCNTQEVEGIDIWYQADAGFQGSDAATIEVIVSTGQYAEVKFAIEVKPGAPTRTTAVSKPVSQHSTAEVAHLSGSAERVVISGRTTKIRQYYQLYPNCKPIGPITVRIVSPPQHGLLESKTGPGFTNYPSDNIRPKCNAQETETTGIWYKSNDGFEGRDETAVEVIFSNGVYADVKFSIDVRGTDGVGGIKRAEDRMLPTTKDASTRTKRGP